MKVFIRADASVLIGTGHVMRCFTLAEQLNSAGAEVAFLCRPYPGNLIEWLCSKGQRVYSLPCNSQGKEDPDRDTAEVQGILGQKGCADWLIVDHYGLDAKWEEQMRPFVGKIMVIDDLADRPHDCDLLLDQNLHHNLETRYQGLTPQGCQLFLGPQYALLRPEFEEARKNQKPRNGTVKRLLVFMGGSDETNETSKSLRAIKLLHQGKLAIDVVIGAGNPHKNEIEELSSQISGAKLYCQVDNMAQLMAEADLMIGAGGSTTWERCFLGLPCITLVLAENQRQVTAAVEKAGATINMGISSKLTDIDLAKALEQALNDPAALKKMSRHALNLMGGRGQGEHNALRQALLGG